MSGPRQRMGAVRRLLEEAAALASREERAPSMEPEVQQAHLERSLNALEHLERILTETGGYMKPADQAALFEARAVLAEHGRIPAGQRAPWVDRT